MELRDVEAFLILADELHFGRTAERLHVTTGRISQTIRKLEREIGATLFLRTSRRVELTPAGKTFLIGAQRGVQELRGAVVDAAATAQRIQDTVRVGYFASIGGEFAARLVSEFEREQPNRRVVLTAMVDRFDFQLVADGELDVLLAWLPRHDPELVGAADLRVGPALATETRALLVADDHPLAGRASISVEDLVDHPVLPPHSEAPAAFLDAWTPRQTPSGRPIPRSDHDLTAMLGGRSIQIQDLLTTVARGAAHLSVGSALVRNPFPGVVAVPVTDLPQCVLVPIWRASAQTAAVLAFVATAERWAARDAGFPPDR